MIAATKYNRRRARHALAGCLLLAAAVASVTAVVALGGGGSGNATGAELRSLTLTNRVMRPQDVALVAGATGEVVRAQAAADTAAALGAFAGGVTNTFLRVYEFEAGKWRHLLPGEEAP